VKKVEVKVMLFKLEAPDVVG